MKFGIIAGVGVGEGSAHPEYLASTVSLAERVGFESVWANERLVTPDYKSNYPYSADGRLPQADDTDVSDPLIWLSYAAALTTTIRLATGIVVLPLRNPVVLAKQVSSLDLLSGGRVMLGVGAGWMPEEADVVGVPYAERGRRTDEYIGAMRALWADDAASFHGDHVNFDRARLYPKPVQAGRQVPVIIAGSGPAAARRAGRIGDGYFPIAPTIEALADQIAIMQAAAKDAGRSSSDIEISVLAFSLTGPDPVSRAQMDEFRRMQELGVSRIVAPRLLDSRIDTMLDSVERLGEQLLGAY